MFNIRSAINSFIVPTKFTLSHTMNIEDTTATRFGKDVPFLVYCGKIKTN